MNKLLIVLYLYAFKATHWLVDPEDVSTVCEGLIWPKVGHGLGLDPRALFPFQHAGTCCAIQGVDLTEK